MTTNNISYELAVAAFYNEIEGIKSTDENRQYKALKRAYNNAVIYGTDNNIPTANLRRAIRSLAKSMGYKI